MQNYPINRVTRFATGWGLSFRTITHALRTMTRKQIRITLQPEFQRDADAICKQFGLRDYSQMLAFLIRTNGSKLLELGNKN